MPIESKDDALKEIEEAKGKILSLERERREIVSQIKSLEEYIEELEYKWGVGFYA